MDRSGNTASLADDVIRYGKQYLGKPYRGAAKGPGAFDCSGYTSFVFKKFGYRLASSSAGQARQLAPIEERENLRKGDLVFFEGNRKNGRVGHVGIVTEARHNGQFRFIHASTSNGVIISSSTEPYYASRYLRAGRVLEENASYVTRRNPALTDQKRMRAESPARLPDIPGVEAGFNSTEKTASTRPTAGTAAKSSPVVVLRQTDPAKNPPLQNRADPEENRDQKNNLIRAKDEMAIREEEMEEDIES